MGFELPFCEDERRKALFRALFREERRGERRRARGFDRDRRRTWSQGAQAGLETHAMNAKSEIKTQTAGKEFGCERNRYDRLWWPFNMALEPTARERLDCTFWKSLAGRGWVMCAAAQLIVSTPRQAFRDAV